MPGADVMHEVDEAAHRVAVLGLWDLVVVDPLVDREAEIKDRE
jgi:hypothetical protein